MHVIHFSCCGSREGTTASIVKLAICLSTVKAGYCFDSVKNKVQVKQTPWPLVGPSLSECTCTMLTPVFEFELCTSRAFIGPAPVQASKKSGSGMPPRLRKAILVFSNCIPHTLNPFHGVTMSYLLCCGSAKWIRAKLTCLLLSSFTHSKSFSWYSKINISILSHTQLLHTHYSHPLPLSPLCKLLVPFVCSIEQVGLPLLLGSR